MRNEHSRAIDIIRNSSAAGLMFLASILGHGCAPGKPYTPEQQPAERQTFTYFANCRNNTWFQSPFGEWPVWYVTNTPPVNVGDLTKINDAYYIDDYKKCAQKYGDVTAQNCTVREGSFEVTICP